MRFLLVKRPNLRLSPPQHKHVVILDSTFLSQRLNVCVNRQDSHPLGLKPIGCALLVLETLAGLVYLVVNGQWPLGLVSRANETR